MTCVHKEYAVKVKMIQGQRSVETEVFIGLYFENHYLVGRGKNIWWGKSTWWGEGVIFQVGAGGISKFLASGGTALSISPVAWFSINLSYDHALSTVLFWCS